jgi:hypothetical protein
VLVDTNVIIRSFQPNSPDFESARTALKTLKAQGRDLSLASQKIWLRHEPVATRPIESNGLGMTIEEATTELTRLKEFLQL